MSASRGKLIEMIDATTESVIWTMSELATTIVCVSIPALRPLYRSIRGGSSSNDASNYNNLAPYGKSSGRRTEPPDYILDTMVTTTVNGKDTDNDSDGGRKIMEVGEDTDTRHMLERPMNSNTIYQVNEVVLSYEDRRPGDGNMGDNMPSVPVKARQHI